MTAPLVSVLMPAFRHERFVGAAVESVLAQSHAHLELIVIDDCSPDNTWGVLQTFRDDRLRLRRHERNLGAHASLNEALAQAQGDYLAILNSDDVYAPTRLERLLAAVAGKGAVLAFSDVDFVTADGVAIGAHPRLDAYRDLCRLCDSLGRGNWFLAGNPTVSTSNFFFSRALLERVGDFAPLRYTHDWDWALRACRHAAPVWLREPLLAYRVHEANTLAEADTWRHIHENSHIQAAALWALRSDTAGASAAETCRALLGNESLHPLALVCYLVARQTGLSERESLALSLGQEGRWWLGDLAEAAACPEPMFRSTRHFVAQAAMLEERLRTIERMNREVAHRDEAIAAQAALLEERLRIIEHMNQEVAHRDEAIAGQAALLEERLRIIEHMNQEVAHRDEAVAGQAALLEERMAAMDSMGREIAYRDAALETASSRIADLERERAILDAHPLVRIARRMSKDLRDKT